MHGGRVYEHATTHSTQIEDILDFSANINPLGPPEGVWPAIEHAWSRIRHYPDSRHVAVKQAIGHRFGIDPANLVCGNGAAEVMDLIFRAIHPARTFVLNPAFSEYESIAKRYGSTVCTMSLWQEDTLKLPLLRLDQSMRRGDLLVLNTPHNPSGAVFPKASWMEAVETWTRLGIHVLIDESFLDFYSDSDKETAMYAAVCTPYLHVIRSATKIFSIPGLRFGFGVVHSEVARQIENERDGWSVNVLAQVAAEVAYLDRPFLFTTHDWLRAAHAWVEATWHCDDRIEVYPSSVNFILIRHASIDVAIRWRKALLEQNILVRDCSSYRTLDAAFTRVALRTSDENERLWLTSTRILNGMLQR